MVTLIRKKMASRVGALLGDVTLLEELCHCGVGFEASFVQTSLNVTVSGLPVACKM